MAKKTKLFYLDDSGSEKLGLAVFGWIEVDIEDWGTVLSEIQSWREELSAEHGIPKSYELHAVNFVNGRGNPSTNEAWNRKKVLRQQITDDLFERINGWSLSGIGRVITRTTARRHAFAQIRGDLYATFVRTLDDRLTANNELGIVIVDGDGTDYSYARAHRKLAIKTRSIIEDPLFQHAHTSLLVQIADFIAYAAFQNEIKQPNKQFSWNWFEKLQKQEK